MALRNMQLKKQSNIAFERLDAPSATAWGAGGLPPDRRAKRAVAHSRRASQDRDGRRPEHVGGRPFARPPSLPIPGRRDAQYLGCWAGRHGLAIRWVNGDTWRVDGEAFVPAAAIVVQRDGYWDVHVTSPAVDCGL